MDPDQIGYHIHHRHSKIQTNCNSIGRPELYQKCNRGSHSSDTSSAYSGSDTMMSVHSSSLDGEEVDLSGLVESVVDSDEEDLAESIDSLAIRDTVRECLEKDPSDRTEEDIETLLEFTKNLQAFTNMTLTVRRALCSVMVFAVVEKGGTMVMNDGEELDSWSVLINGHVEIEHITGEKEELQVGDSFGILPTMDTLYHRGVMRTKCDDCQFVCITQTDYYRIQHQGEENTKRHEENGVIVLVTELRHGASDGTPRRGHVVIRGTPERLMLQLIEENSITDPTYVEDFLLTFRTFITGTDQITKQLLEWFEDKSGSLLQSLSTPSEIRDRVTRVVLLWVNNHFTDFESDPEMMKFLEIFEIGLEKMNMLEQLRLLHIACAAKARNRVVTLARSSRDENLHFTIIGGYENGGHGIFVLKVDKNTKAEDVGLKRGDQIIEVNGNNFEHVTLSRALELMTGTTHLCLTVKSNLLQFKEILQVVDSDSPRPRSYRKTIPNADVVKLHVTSKPRARLSSADLLPQSHDQTDCTQLQMGSVLKPPAHQILKTDQSSSNSTNTQSTSSSSTKGSGGFMTLGPKRRIQKALIKMNLYPKNSNSSLLLDTDDRDEQNIKMSGNNTLQSNFNSSTSTISNTSTGSNELSVGGSNKITENTGNSNKSSCNATNSNNYNLYHSQSNPDLTSIYYDDLRTSDYPEHVLKVYKADQSCKYLLVHKETTAHEVVMLALQEFGIHETSSNFSLCEVSVGEGGMIKQKRLPDQMQNLAERIGLSARYYLKTNGITETLVPDDMAPDLVRESAVHFLQLNANEVAIQLTVQDFAIFRQIEPTEYVDDLFEINSKYGVPMLKPFSELVNKEMFWVVTEVCSELNIVRRMKIIKQFIKIARHCKECKNFNSMFAILSGLGHAAVSRLRLTWEKLPTKYQKHFNDLQEFMDPSRNMSKYRQLVLAELISQHPIIPFYPVVKKDLTFIHLGNDTFVESLINFEKLRMIAKEIRSLTHMCSSPYDLLTMLELRGQPPTTAMVALNQMSSNYGVRSTGGNHYSGHSSGSLASTISNIASVATGQATVKRRKKSAAAPNPKKMFEEAQMVRRVKSYLNNIKVISEEDNLHQLSMECEQNGNSAPNSVIIRKRHPSPTLSTTSSTSSTSEGRRCHLNATATHPSVLGGPPKFGAASPQSVKKMLSLSEQNKTRPHQPRHPNAPLLGAAPPSTATVSGMVGVSPHHNIAQHPSYSPSALYSPIHHHNYGSTIQPNIRTSASPSPLPSPGAHRRVGSTSSTGPSSSNSIGVSSGRAVHERSHSDGTGAPLPSVDLSKESSSVTSLSNLPLRKSIISGSGTSSDSGNGSFVPSGGLDTQSNISENVVSANNTGSVGLYHVACSIVHNSPSTAISQPQRRHSALLFHQNQLHHSGHNIMPTYPTPPNTFLTSQGISTHLPQQFSKNNSLGSRYPPAYNVATQRALLHRLGRAHSHEGVTSTISLAMQPSGYYQPNMVNPSVNLLGNENDEDNDEDGAQVSAV